MFAGFLLLKWLVLSLKLHLENNFKIIIEIFGYYFTLFYLCNKKLNDKQMAVHKTPKFDNEEQYVFFENFSKKEIFEMLRDAVALMSGEDKCFFNELLIGIRTDGMKGILLDCDHKKIEKTAKDAVEYRKLKQRKNNA